MNTSEGPYVGAKRGTRSLTGMAMHFASAISVIVPRPFVDTRADRRMGWMTPPVALPCIGVPPRAASRNVFGDERTARRHVRVVAHPEALLTCSAGNNADDGGPIVGRRAVAFAFIGASTWRIAGIAMGRAVFPRRAGRVHRPQRRYRSSRRLARWRAGGPARADATCAAVGVIPPTPGRSARWVRLSPSHVAGVSAWLGVAGSWQRRCGSGAYSRRHTNGTGRPGRRPAAGRVGARGSGRAGMPTPQDAGDAPTS